MEQGNPSKNVGRGKKGVGRDGWKKRKSLERRNGERLGLRSRETREYRRTCKKNRDGRRVAMGEGSSRVLGYKESQANNLLSHVSHGDLTTVAIVGQRVLPPISSDPSSNVFSPHPFLHVHFSPASATIPDVVETNSTRTGES